MVLSAHQQALLDDFSFIEDLQERLAAVIDHSRKQPQIPESGRTEANRVTGCQSQVWIVSTCTDNTLSCVGDSDSPLVRGLVTFTCDFFTGETLSRILASDTLTDPIELLGLSRQLSATRKSGLAAVRARIRESCF